MIISKDVMNREVAIYANRAIRILGKIDSTQKKERFSTMMYECYKMLCLQAEGTYITTRFRYTKKSVIVTGRYRIPYDLQWHRLKRVEVKYK